ncbi:MAG: LPXTG cell wall anchor domain-containing protein [Actinomycetota bacterium]|nr:LPXTG cell wall anchor domain-containing protein [Actinomycetota bacterium]
MSRKRIITLLLVGVFVATTIVLAMYGPAQAASYGSGGSPGASTTGADLGLFALVGAALLGIGYFLTRRSKA